MIREDPFYYQIIIQIYEWPRFSSSKSNFASSTPAFLCCLAVRWCLWRASGETLEKGADETWGHLFWGCHQTHDAVIRLLVHGETFPDLMIQCCPQPLASGIDSHSMSYMGRGQSTRTLGGRMYVWSKLNVPIKTVSNYFQVKVQSIISIPSYLNNDLFGPNN